LLLEAAGVAQHRELIQAPAGEQVVIEPQLALLLQLRQLLE
jgi:hypothetical protein